MLVLAHRIMLELEVKMSFRGTMWINPGSIQLIQLKKILYVHYYRKFTIYLFTYLFNLVLFTYIHYLTWFYFHTFEKIMTEFSFWGEVSLKATTYLL